MRLKDIDQFVVAQIFAYYLDPWPSWQLSKLKRLGGSRNATTLKENSDPPVSGKVWSGSILYKLLSKYSKIKLQIPDCFSHFQPGSHLVLERINYGYLDWWSHATDREDKTASTTWFFSNCSILWTSWRYRVKIISLQHNSGIGLIGSQNGNYCNGHH